MLDRCTAYGSSSGWLTPARRNAAWGREKDLIEQLGCSRWHWVGSRSCKKDGVIDMASTVRSTLDTVPRAFQHNPYIIFAVVCLNVNLLLRHFILLCNTSSPFTPHHSPLGAGGDVRYNAVQYLVRGGLIAHITFHFGERKNGH